MSIVTIPTRTSADANSSADINTLMLNDLALYASLGSGGGSSEKYITFTLRGNLYVGTTINFALIGFTGTLIDVGAYAITAPTGASIQIDVNKNGTSMLTTVCEIDAGSNADDGNRAIKTDGTEDVVDGDRVSIDIDQVGSTVAGADLSIYLEFE